MMPCAVGLPHRVVDPEQQRLCRWLYGFWFLGLFGGCVFALALGIRLRPEVARDSPWLCMGRVAAEVLCAAAVEQGFSRTLIPAAAFFRAAVFGYTAQGIRAGFGSAGWLLWPQMMLPQLLVFPLLLLLWLQPPGSKRSRAVCFLSVAAAAAIGYVDFRLVMPFAASLIE